MNYQTPYIQGVLKHLPLLSVTLYTGQKSLSTLLLFSQGLIVNVSSMGGLKYLFNVAYGVGRASVAQKRNIFESFQEKQLAIGWLPIVDLS